MEKEKEEKGRDNYQPKHGKGGDFTINEDGGSTEEEDNNESNEAKVKMKVKCYNQLVKLRGEVFQ